jgi:hypothetical protein
MKLNGTRQLLVSADDVNLLGDNTENMKRNTDTLTGASKDDDLEVNTQKAKYMLLSRHQNARQNHDMIDIRCFKSVAQFKYLEMTVTNQNLIQEEIKRRLNSSNACHHSVQNLLSSRLLSKNTKIIIYKIISLLWFCMGVKLGTTVTCTSDYIWGFGLVNRFIDHSQVVTTNNADFHIINHSTLSPLSLLSLVAAW